jgi:hypothetical protein
MRPKEDKMEQTPMPLAYTEQQSLQLVTWKINKIEKSLAILAKQTKNKKGKFKTEQRD